MSRATFKRPGAVATLIRVGTEGGGSGSLRCDQCHVGWLRMERDPLTGMTSERCTACGHTVQHRSAAHQAHMQAMLAAQPAKYKHRRHRRAPRRGR